jgi:hypothetical protein
MDIGDCQDCVKARNRKHYGIYTMKCAGCRQRLVLDEPCKLLRKALAEGLKRYGAEPEWKIEPNCGCQFSCERLTNIRLAKHQSMM